jgi:hypothetical protein
MRINNSLIIYDIGQARRSTSSLNIDDEGFSKLHSGDHRSGVREKFDPVKDFLFLTNVALIDNLILPVPISYSKEAQVRYDDVQSLQTEQSVWV